jgi:dTDP-4-amino-4,6-dideoxygalactose transaminase
MAEVGFREWLAVGRAIADRELLRYTARKQFTRTFEQELARTVGVKHALTVTSGTGALIAALTAAGVGPGDEVLVPAYTWMATASAPVIAGAVPVLVDINESLTIDPADIERKITPYTRAIMPVHMINAPADMDAVMAIARRHKLLVIEDACQSVGVRYKGRHCGTIGDIGAFSFNRHKNMNIGEGGAVLTNDDRLFARALNYHDLGIWARDFDTPSDEPPFVGVNMRMTEIQGAMLHVQLSRLQGALARMQSHRAIIARELAKNPRLTISPHNDPDSAVTLTVIFETEAEAAEFATRKGVYRVYDNSKHVYTNWGPILERRTAHPAMNPWAWAKRDIAYSAGSCARSLDILKRTCRIALFERRPNAMLPAAVRHLTV